MAPRAFFYSRAHSPAAVPGGLITPGLDDRPRHLALQISKVFKDHRYTEEIGSLSQVLDKARARCESLPYDPLHGLWHSF